MVVVPAVLLVARGRRRPRSRGRCRGSSGRRAVRRPPRLYAAGCCTAATSLARARPQPRARDRRPDWRRSRLAGAVGAAALGLFGGRCASALPAGDRRSRREHARAALRRAPLRSHRRLHRLVDGRRERCSAARACSCSPDASSHTPSRGHVTHHIPPTVAGVHPLLAADRRGSHADPSEDSRQPDREKGDAPDRGTVADANQVALQMPAEQKPVMDSRGDQQNRRGSDAEQ